MPASPGPGFKSGHYRLVDVTLQNAGAATFDTHGDIECVKKGN